MSRAMVNKDIVRENIIHVARGIFAKFGFKKTTMDEIALATGKGKSSIYYYYDCKEDIFRAVVEREANMIKNKLIATVSEQDNPVDKLSSYVKTRMAAFRELINFYEALKNDSLTHLDFIEATRKRFDEEEINMVIAILARGNEKGLFKVKDVNLGAVSVVTAMKGLEVPMYATTDNLKVEDRINSVIDLIYFGIVK